MHFTLHHQSQSSSKTNLPILSSKLVCRYVEVVSAVCSNGKSVGSDAVYVQLKGILGLACWLAGVKDKSGRC